MMKNLCLIWGDDYISIQERPYIEDGWYIRVLGRSFVVFEINTAGGVDEQIGEYSTLQEALERTTTLT